MEILRTIILYVAIGLIPFVGCSQITSAQEAYKQLDAFLETPSEANTLAFLEVVRAWNPTNNEDRLAKVVSLCNLGYNQQRYFQFKEAIYSYEEAKRLFQQYSLKGFNMIEFCYKPLGNLYTKTNALSEAENIIREYILEAQRQERKEDEASGLLNLSVVFQNKGNYHQAIQILKQGILLAPNNDKLVLNLANNYLSLDDITTAENIMKPVMLSNEVHVNALQLWASIQLKKGEPLRALEVLKQCEQYYQNWVGLSLREWLKLKLALAQTQWMLKNAEEAKKNLFQLYRGLIPDYSSSDGLPSENRLFPDNTLIDALDLHAAIFAFQNQEQQALKAYDLAFKVTDMMDEPSMLQHTKLWKQNENKIRTERCLDLLYGLYQKDKKATWLERAFSLEQGTKSPVLQEARRIQELLFDKEDSLVNALQRSKRALTELELKLEQIRKLGVHEASTFQKTQEEYNSILLEQRRVYTALNSVYPFLGKGSTLTVKQLMDHCRNREETIVSYFMGKETLYQFIVNEKGIEMNRLNSITINVILQYINNYILYFENSNRIANDPQGFAQASYALYKAIQLPRTERLVVIPDGLLSFVPLAALLTQEVVGSEFEGMPWLLNETQVTYALSVDNYLNAGNEMRESKVLGLFPVFADTPRALDFSLEEAKGIQKNSDATILIKEEATATSFFEQSPDYSILHISTHASGGSFTNPAVIELADRTVSVEELYGFEFRKDLVVLSACETGVGKVIRGEGVQNMARAFQYTGTDNVLFSLWNVNDYSTAHIMQDFYREFENTGLKGPSLHRSQLSYLKESNLDNTKKSPYYWAAFVHYGVVETPKSRMGYLLWFLFGAMAITALLFVSRKYVKNKP
ncbi:MAG: hypothetical protein Aureis2KO_02360 [Aureisphaera sp.]